MRDSIDFELMLLYQLLHTQRGKSHMLQILMIRTYSSNLSIWILLACILKWRKSTLCSKPLIKLSVLTFKESINIDRTIVSTSILWPSLMETVQVTLSKTCIFLASGLAYSCNESFCKVKIPAIQHTLKLRL